MLKQLNPVQLKTTNLFTWRQLMHAYGIANVSNWLQARDALEKTQKIEILGEFYSQDQARDFLSRENDHLTFSQSQIELFGIKEIGRYVLIQYR